MERFHLCQVVKSRGRARANPWPIVVSGCRMAGEQSHHVAKITRSIPLKRASAICQSVLFRLRRRVLQRVTLLTKSREPCQRVSEVMQIQVKTGVSMNLAWSESKGRSALTSPFQNADGPTCLKAIQHALDGGRNAPLTVRLMFCARPKADS